MFHFRIFGCTDLPIKDANGKIDSYVTIETKGKDQKPRDMGRTAVVQNDLNPTYPDKIFDVPSDDCYTVKFTVMDEDPLKDDMACWIKIKAPSLMFKLGEKITKQMVVKNPENHPNCRPMITFMCTLDGQLAEDHPAAQEVPKPKAEKVTLEPFTEKYKLNFNILVLQPEAKKYYFSENQNTPSFIQKDGDKYTIDPEGQGNLIVVPVWRTQRSFKRSEIKVRYNGKEITQLLKFRGEWLMNKALVLPENQVKEFKPVHRNNHTTNKWISLLPEELAPKGDYTEF